MEVKMAVIVITIDLVLSSGFTSVYEPLSLKKVDMTVGHIMKLALFLLAVLPSIEANWGQCREANWKGKFNKKSWVRCDHSTEYMTGLYRTDGNNADISLIEKAMCCQAPSPNQHQQSFCKKADWWKTLDRSKDVEKTFDKKGWGKCSNGYYMAGFYKGTCDKVYCIEKFRCCSMSDDGCTMADWWSAFDNKGSVECSSSTQYITGLWRNKQANDDKIYLLEEAKCCPAPAPNKHTPSTCQKANWWKILDGNNVWAVCPTGYFIRGFYRNDNAWLHNIEEATCCKPNSFPNRYEDCYDENIGSSFDNIGLSECSKNDYYVVGIYKGGCDELHCIKTLKCCKMVADINECTTKNPCHNGAICVNLHGSYRCDCKSGYTGNNCQKDINECLRSPCKNGAECVNVRGSYRCDCKSGYEGRNCEKDINECNNNPCKNRATCENLQGSYRCKCKPGFTNKNCQTDINECKRKPCQNGATCVNTFGSYRCRCVSGYNGQHCQADIDECKTKPCINGGKCENLPGSYRCNCRSGFMGYHCQTDIDECYSAYNPCRNGGTCVNSVGGYSCHCKARYSGINCEIDYKNVGCYKDTSSRAIPTLEDRDPILDGQYSSRKNPIAKCALAARKKGYRMFAIQDGGWCASSATAGKTFNKYGKSDACRQGEGGAWANDVYILQGQ
ncbi:unnamed protein product [Porites lobata]|uniref:EGF-like domain-containing protein n=1 Tax=Porites lobata TaxID=104759 RepID=A0ABN8RJ89_9CNID|nr:unnamed protein product [Porites lobata]